MGEWREFKIKDIALNMADAPFGSNLKTKDYTDDGVVVLQGKNIQGRKCVWSDTRFVSREKYSILSKHHAKLGCLVFPKVGTIGKVGILTSFSERTEYLLSTNSMMLEPDPKIAHQDFVYYFFASPKVRNHIEAISSNSVQPVFNFTSLKNYSIHLPPLPEQKAIAAVLSGLDDKIDLLQRQNRTLEALAETLFRQWFVEGAQEEWEEGCLEDIADNVRDGVSHNNISPGTIYIGLEHIDRKNISLNRFGYSDNLQSNKHLFYENDILFGKLRPYFHKVTFAPFSGVCSTDILVIRAKRPELFNFCLFAFYQSDVVEYANLGSEGTRMPRTNWNTLKQYPIMIPDDSQLDKYNQVVDHAIDKIKQNQSQIRTLEQLRDTLLPKLMSGEVRVEI